MGRARQLSIHKGQHLRLPAKGTTAPCTAMDCASSQVKCASVECGGRTSDMWTVIIFDGRTGCVPNSRITVPKTN